MVNIVPFQGFRPTPEYAQKVASVPYDVVSSEEARELAKDNEYSFLRVVKPEITLDSSIDIYHDHVYNQGAQNLRKLVEQQTLVKDPQRCFYIYRQQLDEHIQTGLVVGASVADYQNDLIKKHEHTRHDKELDRTRHIDALNCNTGPVFLTYSQNNNVDNLISELCVHSPEYQLTSEDRVEHTFWVVKDAQKIKQMQSLFTAIDKLYVADGHHRSAAATRVANQRCQKNPLHTGQEAYNFFLAVVFPHNQMQILPYNRVVHDLAGLDVQEFMEKLHSLFFIAESTSPIPKERHSFGMFLDSKWHMLTAKPEIIDENDPVKCLDVSILQKQILNPLLKIEDPRKDKRITFVGGARGSSYLEKSVQSRGEGVAFYLYPTDIKSLMAIADAGEVMPPKSTWFEPKLRSGLIIHPLV